MDSEGGVSASPIIVALVGIMSAAIVISIYHCIAVGWCGPRPSTFSRSRIITEEQRAAVPNTTADVQLVIPAAYGYKHISPAAGGEEILCAVCLCEFKEGEDVRVLPECLHAYHVPCIDMWLYSHSNCPLCRTDTTLLTCFRPVGGMNYGRLPNIGG